MAKFAQCVHRTIALIRRTVCGEEGMVAEEWSEWIMEILFVRIILIFRAHKCGVKE